MNCKDFETLLADALGGELEAHDRPAFDAHLAACGRCRADFDTALAALERMRSLPTADTPAEFRAERSQRWHVAQAAPRPIRWRLGGLFRYAASVLIAFSAGYLVHGELSGSPLAPPSRPTADRAPETELIERRVPGQAPVLAATVGRSFETALAGAHRRSPSSSDLTKCMIAMFHTGR